MLVLFYLPQDDQGSGGGAVDRGQPGVVAEQEGIGRRRSTDMSDLSERGRGLAEGDHMDCMDWFRHHLFLTKHWYFNVINLIMLTLGLWF